MKVLKVLSVYAKFFSQKLRFNRFILSLLILIKLIILQFYELKL